VTVADLVERIRARRQLPVPRERRAIRERAGVSLREAAAALGVTHAAIWRWERGSTPRQHIAAYAQLLDELRRLAPEMREPDLGRAQDSRDDYNDDKPAAG
jgi:transcriptional regulator with XRE-family HTH domain